MKSNLNPYLTFRDTARPAMEFYQSVFGGDLTVNTFKEYQVSDDQSENDKVMHSMLDAPNGIKFMAADTPNRTEHRPGTNMSMSLSGDDEAELTAYFNRLSEGGSVSIPLAKAPWGDLYGSCVDKFGITWMVNVTMAR